MAQSLGYTQTLFSGRIFPGLRAQFLGVDQEPVLKTGLSWEYGGFGHPS